jgi:hypothetical protein
MLALPADQAQRLKTEAHELWHLSDGQPPRRPSKRDEAYNVPCESIDPAVARKLNGDAVQLSSHEQSAR